LIKEGHKVTVVSGTYSHLRNQQPKRNGMEDIDGITYLWLKTPSYKGNGIMRVISMVVFMLQLFLHMAQILRVSQPKVVIGSTVYMLDMFPAWVMSKFSRAMLVFELHDLWPMSPMQLGDMSAWHPFILLLQIAQWWTYKVADRVISILPNTYEHMKQFGILPQQFYYIPNGVVQQDWEPQKKPQVVNHLERVKALKQSGKFLVCYAGSHGVSNDLNHLVDAAAFLQRNCHHNIHFLLIGDGPEKIGLQQYAEDMGLANIEFLSRVNKSEIIILMQKMDVMFFALKPLPLYQYGIGLNKLFDYMMAAKPIIGAWESRDALLEQLGCGITIAPSDPEAIAAGVLQIAAMSAEDRNRLGKAGREYVLAHHDYAKLAHDFMLALR
jgi:glycosyltransferase involved in cell wall biosynthesis